jgi:hypothetical protein
MTANTEHPYAVVVGRWHDGRVVVKVSGEPAYRVVPERELPAIAPLVLTGKPRP